MLQGLMVSVFATRTNALHRSLMQTSLVETCARFFKDTFLVRTHTSQPTNHTNPRGSPYTPNSQICSLRIRIIL